MRMRDFIKENKEEIDRTIKSECPNAPLNNQEREVWIMNNEYLYNLARYNKVNV